LWRPQIPGRCKTCEKLLAGSETLWNPLRPVARPVNSHGLSAEQRGFIYQDTRPMAYAIIKTGGKQHKVAVGDKLDVTKIEVNEGENATFEVLAHGEGDSLVVGTPVVTGATVVAKVLRQFKAAKVISFKFKRRKGYH